MILIPGFIITLVTFPGYVMQTVARRFTCDVLGIAVYEAHYLKGTIIHHRVVSPLKAVLIAYAPLAINSALCAILMFPVAFTIFLGTEPGGLDDVVRAVLAWAGISIGMHALPASATVKKIEGSISGEHRRGFGYALLRISGLGFRFVNLFRPFWVDLVLALVIGFAVPYLVVRLIMRV
jgi:hypothetical protein